MFPRHRNTRWAAAGLALAGLILGWRIWSGSAPTAGAAARRESQKVPADARTSSAANAAASERASVADAPRSPAGNSGGNLFAYAQPANAAQLDAALPAPTRAIHYVRLNPALLAGKQSPFWQPRGTGRLVVPLPDGGDFTVVIDDAEMLGPDRFTSVGRVEGHPLSRAIFAYHQGFLHATFEHTAAGSFALRAANGEFSQFFRVEPDLQKPCGGGVTPVIDAEAIAAAAERARRRSALAGPAGATESLPNLAAAEFPGRIEVHLMMVYTQAVMTTLSGSARQAAVQSAFDGAVASMNAALSASLISTRVRLVKVIETNYPADSTTTTLTSGWQQSALTALYRTNDGNMDEIHTARDAAGADLVMLAVNKRDASSRGLSYVLQTPSSESEALEANYNPLFAFGVVEYESVTGSNVVPHELGHLFGNSHARGDPGATAAKDGAFTYSYGYRFFGANGRQYHDIMAYFPGTELSYFSNPRLTLDAPISRPIGIPAGLADSADAARTIDETAFELASFRLQTQAQPSPGTLVNVSTRGFVGTGDQVMIAGFVLNGAKRVLIRAAGPALANYGVTDFLADPVVTVFSGANSVARNDDWGVQSAGTTPAAVAAAGGFPFPTGSRDAALLVTLPRGAYTAIVEGKGAATGSGLVEVYEADGTGAKLINLSTRAYADRRGKEMFGGFVVQGAAGTTKRVLVRVLGPTLGRAPYNLPGVLTDPIMEVRSGAGELLIKNDDWSTNAEGGPSPENDFRPTIAYYSEKQIAATGLAPTNRREPAVMLDLAPGGYTVIVRPFELFDPLLGIDQAAEPGSAIIEVYEISP